ncbi:MAG: HAMP domain-containing protein [Proteobacteria bacterium]|nr:HAMP domain-containing protein [Pseudomonadota bacterium]
MTPLDKPGEPGAHMPQDSWLKWPEPAALERIMPRTLMARVSLTIVVPLILVQLISTYVFYDNHWDTMSRRMAQDLAGDIASVSALMVEFQDPKQREWVAANAKQTMELDINFTPGAKLERVDAVNEPEDLALFREALRGVLRQPFSIDRFAFRTDRLVAIRVQTEDGVITVLAPRRRIFSNSTLVFVIWMVGSSMLLFGVATVYLRSQVAIVRRLARAAENFGKGREVPDFPSDGPYEVRQAARAFNLMRARIQRQIAQRTEMLAGVSHDLRTPLTRLKLQLAMMENRAEDIADLREDVAEMERMLEAYLAFARGDGAEEAAPANVGERIEDVVGRFRRDGKGIGLAMNGLPKQMALKAVAFERSLGNLISNAVRYGTRIEVHARRVDGSIHIDVDDDGPGIPADKREEVFRAFHRLEPSRNQETGGIGLGLTITRDIVRGMGGEVMLGDSPLGGLRATVTIPL